MSWLTPLGFLGLVSIIVLILIYIIKPNFQNKIISSTFVWKLSLKYKKKRLPLNKLRNVLLFLCQILVLTLATVIIAQPFLNMLTPDINDKVIIIDASASMLTTTGGTTRFESAIESVKKEATEYWEKEEEGKLTVILAKDTASYVVQQAGVESKTKAFEALNALVDKTNGIACTYGSADIKGAIKLAEEITAFNHNVEVSMFTDTNYIDAGSIKVNKVGDVNDWNAAILDARAVMDENYVRFEIDVACYGKDRSVKLYCDIIGINDTEERLSLEVDVRCDGDETKKVVFGKVLEDRAEIVIAEEISVYSYDYAYIRIDEKDSYDYDNSFYLYGGAKQSLRIQYVSEKPNNFFSSALMVLRDQLKYRWDVELTQIGPEGEAETEGFDLYIYEHKMPSKLPTDGAVLMVNPDKAPSGAGFTLGALDGYANETPLAPGEANPVTNGITAENITVTRYKPITNADGYTTLLTNQRGAPVFIAKNEADVKIAVLSLDLHYSNLPVMLEYPLMMYNLIEYFIPSTVTQYVFETGESITLGSRSEELHVTGPFVDAVITEFPAVLDLNNPGIYTVTQTPISNKEVVENFYVRIPASESNINAQLDVLENPHFLTDDGISALDLLFYIAIALVAFLFIEWWLHTREQY